MSINLGQHDVIQQIEKISRPARPLAEWTKRWQELGNRIAETHESISSLLIRSGWPPPLRLPVSGLGDLLTVFELGDLTDEKIAKVFAAHYTEDEISEMVEDWIARPWLGHRVTLLKEAVDNCNKGRYASCVAVMLPNIEGMIGDHFRRMPNPKNDLAGLFRSFGLDKASTEFYETIVLGSFKWSEDSLPSLNRHQILHGRTTSYGTQENALKTILLFDAVQEAINDLRGN